MPNKNIQRIAIPFAGATGTSTGDVDGNTSKICIKGVQTMDFSKTTGEVFEEWGSDHRANEMEEEHWSLVQQAFALIPKMSGNYLEIGVGNGYGIRHMATSQFSEGHCWGLDLASSMVTLSKKKTENLQNVTIEHGDFLEWDFSSNESFSLIFSMEVFYYFPKIQHGIDKAYSLLKPGGQLWVLVNYFKENEISHEWPSLLQTPMQLWSKQDYRDSFVNAGFSAVRQRQFVDPQKTKSTDGSTLCTFGTKPDSKTSKQP